MAERWSKESNEKWQLAILEPPSVAGGWRDFFVSLCIFSKAAGECKFEAISTKDFEHLIYENLSILVFFRA